MHEFWNVFFCLPEYGMESQQWNYESALVIPCHIFSPKCLVCCQLTQQFVGRCGSCLICFWSVWEAEDDSNLAAIWTQEKPRDMKRLKRNIHHVNSGLINFQFTLWWTNIAIENGHRNSGFSWIFPLIAWWIFPWQYVSSPEGISYRVPKRLSVPCWY